MMPWLGDWGYNMHAGGWLGMGIGMLVNIAFWLLIIAFVVRLFKGGGLGGCCGGGIHEQNHNRGKAENHDSAEEILKQRYAKGEITKDEYEEMMKTLGE